MHKKGELAALKAQLIAGLNAAGEVLVEESSGAKRDLTPEGLLILTGGVEREALEAARALREPIVILAHPRHNSLPAALEVLARLRQEGRQGLLLYGEPDQVAARLALQARVAAAWRKFAGSRLGLIGRPSDWLVASGVKPERLRELGIELVELDTAELLGRVRALEGRAFDNDLRKLRQGRLRRPEVDHETLAVAIRVYHGLRELAEEHGLSALTIRCFDLIESLGNTACYALSRLNDEGITAGCEGDMQALLSMHLGRLLTGQPAFMGNVAQLDLAKCQVLLAHCTCPLALASSHELRSHFESGRGVGIAARLHPGPATLFRIGEEELSRLFVAQGMIRPREPEEGLCRTQVLIELERPPEELLEAPLGNHHVLLLGRHREELEALFHTYLWKGVPQIGG
ncbi:MAG: hypothetical protein NUW06_01980 [Candidatus Acetothermia bacterium]|nr:hypothetical protein [Candidatus Acetothermia bacterium]MDH7504661.1 hypothetical protein [Candidatus Acetothermia bacterium]